MVDRLQYSREPSIVIAQLLEQTTTLRTLVDVAAHLSGGRLIDLAIEQRL